MWADEATNNLYTEMSLLACSKHQLQVKKLPKYSQLTKKMKSVFWMLKIQVMDPFLFNVSYDDIPDNWLKNSHFFSDRSFIPLVNRCGLSSEIMEKILGMECISTYVIALLCRICCVCNDLETEEDMIDYYDTKYCVEYAESLTKLDNLELKDALTFVKAHPFYEEVRNHFVKFDESLVTLSFLFSYFFFLDTSNDPDIAVKHFTNVLRETTDGMLNRNGYNNFGKEEYKKSNYKTAIEIYTKDMCVKYYNYYCFGNRAQCFLKLNLYLNAELDSRAAIMTNPEWCKGYYRLSQALKGQEKLHEAHMAVDFGLNYCESVSSEENTMMLDFRDDLVENCKLCKENSANRLPESQEQLKQKTPGFDNVMDVPELTDSSETDVSDENPSEDEYEDPCEENISEQAPVQDVENAGKNCDMTYSEMSDKSQTKNKTGESKQSFPSGGESAKHDESKTKSFSDYLLEGSSAMVNGSYLIAQQHFHEALILLKTDSQLQIMDDSHIVSLKYAYGMACCKSGSLENLQKAISTFMEILNKYHDVIFPATLYGLALSYYKLNKFKESLAYLEKLSSCLQQLGEVIKVYFWPGTQEPIEETCCSKLKVLVEGLVKECECPPQPDAKCCYNQCTLQPAIYLSDPGFKGFVSLHCSERCMLQYHIPCWKSIKEMFDKTDKEFIDSSCLTPDCGGSIILLEAYGKQGSVDKCFESESKKLEAKKNIKHKKTRLEKKLEIKEQRKLKRHRSESHDKAVEEVLEKADVEQFKPGADKLPDKEKEHVSASVPQFTAVKPVSSELSATAKPFYIIKKDIENKFPEVKSKHKEKKKPKKSTFSIDEFCADFSKQDVSYYNEYQMRLHRLQETKRVIEENDAWPAFCESERIPELDPHRPYHIPEGLRNDPGTLESVLELCGSVPQNEDSKALKEYIYERFENILQEKGTLNVNDPLITDELQDLPAEWQNIITESGGFKSFMLQSMKFAVVEDTLCFFSDMLNLYKSSQVSELDDFCQIYGSADNVSVDSSSVLPHFSVEKNISELNPNAAEYSPSDSRSDISISHSASGDLTGQQLNSEVNLNGSSSKLQHHTENSTDSDQKNENPLLSVLFNLRKPLVEFSVPSIKDESSMPLEKSASQSLSTVAPRNDVIDTFCNQLSVLMDHISSCDSIPALDNTNDASSALSREQFCDMLKSLFSHMETTSMLAQKVDKREQAGTLQVSLVSVGVQKEDKGFQRLQLEYKSLSEEYVTLCEKSYYLEQQLTESLDSLQQLQNKINVELPTLEKQLLESETLKKEEIKTLKSKISLLEKDLKQWRQKYDALTESERSCNKENEKLNVKLKCSLAKLEDMEKRCAEYESSMNKQRDIVDRCEKVIQENNILMDKKLKECSEAHERAVNAEIQVITVQKNYYVHMLDIIINDGSKKIDELQQTLNNVQSTLTPHLLSSFKLMIVKLKEHADQISKVRIATERKADELIAKIKGGVPYANLDEYKFPNLPPMPSLNDFVKPPTSFMVPPVQQGVPRVSPSNPTLPMQQNYYPNLLPVTDANECSSAFANFNFQPLSSSALPRPAANPYAPNNVYSSLITNPMPGFSGMFNQESNPLTFSNTPVSQPSSAYHVSSPNNQMNSSVAAQANPSFPGPSSKSYFSKETPNINNTVDKNQSAVAGSALKKAASTEDTHGALSQCSSESSGNISGLQDDDVASVNSYHSLGSSKLTKSAASSSHAINDLATAAAKYANKCPAPRVPEISNHASNLELDYAGGEPNPPPAVNFGNSTNIELPATKKVQKPAEKKGNYAKIVERLRSRHPDVPENELVNHIKQFREQRKKLTGMTVEAIVIGVSESIKKKAQKTRQQPNATSRAKPIIIKPFATVSTDPPKVVPSATENPWGKTNAENVAWVGDNTDRCCIICLEEMTSTDSKRMDCGHRFHYACIKQWLDKTSNCPTCRVHLLLPEDYPALS